MTIAFVGNIAQPWANFGPATTAAYTPGAGNQFICFTAVTAPNTAIAVTSTLSSPFNKQTPPGDYDDTFGDLCGIFFCPSTTAGSQTLTLSATTANQVFGWGCEFSGIGSVTNAGGISVAAGATGTGGIRGASVTVPTGSVLLAFCADGASGTGTISSPAGTNIDAGAAYCITAYAGTGTSITPSFTGSQAASDGYFILSVVLNPPTTSATLAAFTGSYAISGKAVTLSSILNLPASSGSYSISGQTLGLFPVSTQLLILANPGTYNYVGSPAFDDFQVPLGVGIYSLRPGNAVFPSVTSYAVSLAPGLYGLTGENAVFATVAPPKFILMPNLIGLNLYEALLLLEQLGIYVPLSVLAFEPSSISVALQNSAATPGTVIAQSVPAGNGVPPKAQILLTLAQFPFGSVVDMPPDDKQVN